MFSTKFATSGSPAYAVLKRFKWSNLDQEIVGRSGSPGDHMDPDKAAKQWIAQNTGQGQEVARQVADR